MTSRLGSVVVTHNSAGVLAPLLSSLASHEPDVDVVVVDSGSSDGPPQLDVSAVALDNVGFGAACNAGVAALGDRGGAPAFIVCLNPDVRLAGPSLTQLVDAMAARPKVGIATGPVVDSNDQRQASAWGPTSPARAFWFASGLQLSRTRALLGRLALGGAATSGASMAREAVMVDGHVLGGAMVVRRECWEQLGGFDEDFFLYWEDADLCQRARDLGWQVAVLPCTPIVHEAGTSSEGVTDDQRWAWYVEGAERFASKHLTTGQARRLLAALAAGRRLAKLRQRRSLPSST